MNSLTNNGCTIGKKNSSLGNSGLSTAKMKDCSWRDSHEGDTEISAIIGSEKRQHSLKHLPEKEKKWTYFFGSQPDLFFPPFNSKINFE